MKSAEGSIRIPQVELHRKHGDAVRIGPNILSLADPALIKTVYNVHCPWKKVCQSRLTH
jgi:hypothetical protein